MRTSPIYEIQDNGIAMYYYCDIISPSGSSAAFWCFYDSSSAIMECKTGISWVTLLCNTGWLWSPPRWAKQLDLQRVAPLHKYLSPSISSQSNPDMLFPCSFQLLILLWMLTGKIPTIATWSVYVYSKVINNAFTRAFCICAMFQDWRKEGGREGRSVCKILSQCGCPATANNKGLHYIWIILLFLQVIKVDNGMDMNFLPMFLTKYSEMFATNCIM